MEPKGSQKSALSSTEALYTSRSFTRRLDTALRYSGRVLGVKRDVSVLRTRGVDRDRSDHNCGMQFVDQELADKQESDMRIIQNGGHSIRQCCLFNTHVRTHIISIHSMLYSCPHRNSDNYTISMEYSFLARGRWRAQRWCHLTAPG